MYLPTLFQLQWLCRVWKEAIAARVVGLLFQSLCWGTEDNHEENIKIPGLWAAF